jgi:hypothetical protein
VVYPECLTCDDTPDDNRAVLNMKGSISALKGLYNGSINRAVAVDKWCVA